MLLIQIRIGIELLTGNIRAFPAMNIAFVLTANSDRAFPMEGVAVCFYAAAAVTGLLIGAVGTVKSAS